MIGLAALVTVAITIHGLLAANGRDRTPLRAACARAKPSPPPWSPYSYPAWLGEQTEQVPGQEQGHDCQGEQRQPTPTGAGLVAQER